MKAKEAENTVVVYSTPDDIIDKLVKPKSIIEDHVEAAGYIDRCFNDPFFNRDKVSGSTIKNLSIIYATHRRAFHEWNNGNNEFWDVYLSYEDRLKNATAALYREAFEKDKYFDSLGHTAQIFKD